MTGPRLPVRAARLPIGAQVFIAILVYAILILGTPTGLFLREMLIGNAIALGSLVKESPTLEERRIRLLGPDYRFLTVVRAGTPEDAVILMSDQYAPSVLEPLRAKHQGWATFFLYPRRVLYLHQQDLPIYREAQWLIVDGPPAIQWMPPEMAPPYRAGPPACMSFDMGAYLDEVDSGRISSQYLPPRTPLRPR